MKCPYSGTCERSCRRGECQLDLAHRRATLNERRLAWTVLGNPRPLLRARHGKGRTYDPKANRVAKTEFLRQSLPHLPATPIPGPVSIEARFYFAIPKSWPKWKREAAASGEWKHEIRPDLSNLIKLVEDALLGHLFEDDDQAWSYRHVSKLYTADEPRTEVAFTVNAQAVKP